MSEKMAVWFEEVGREDVKTVGGKGANLGEMIKAGIPVPYGFIVTVASYKLFLKQGNLSKKIADYIKSINFRDPRSLESVSQLIKKEILKTPVPLEVAEEIVKYYLGLHKKAGAFYKKSSLLKSFIREPLVAVRSSATAEDLPNASFAGQQATFLNVTGDANVVHKVRQAWASLFEARAIFYRHEQHLDHTSVGIAVPVQLMVSSTSSGIMFTIDPVTNDKNKIVIEAIYGLGELIVQGSVTPDHFEIDKNSMKIISDKISSQKIMLTKENSVNKLVKVSPAKGTKPKITRSEVIEIAKLGKTIEKHYFFPQDIEWAIEKGQIYIVQSRPVTTTKSQKSDLQDQIKNIQFPNSLIRHPILKGDPASPGIASGFAKIILSKKEIGKLKKGEVLVTRETNPDFVPAMKKAVAIVTERGGRTSHAAIVSRELGIPAIVGTERAMSVLKTGLMITVNGSTGEVYKGGMTNQPKVIHTVGITHPEDKIIKTATRVYVNLASAERVAEVSKKNADGVGLLRAEFMIAGIGVHPKKLIKEKKESLFINKLAADLISFCRAFNPRPVVYRATDFKTNEYRNLIGGKMFEPEEPNPMLGFRGAFRYIADPEVFEMELAAIKMVRNKYGFKNLWLMIPFVRTVHDLLEVKKIIAANGLLRSDSFKLWMMVEIPSNVILLDKFCEVGIDGVSIGSNDLTMLILGTDRDNSEVAEEFNERNDAVLWALERVIKICHKYNITSSICGQAPSDYPDLVEKLINWGITSVSVNPDALDRTREIIYHFEKRLVGKK